VSPTRGLRFSYVTCMTSSENRLPTLYREIESRLERGETSSTELRELLAELSTLQSDADVWFNLDPKGISDLARLEAEVGRTAAGWR
jgi:hypothetical protein